MFEAANPCSGHLTHCVTCSDEAMLGRVVETMSGGIALVEFESADFEEVSLQLVEAAPGDLVLVHARVAIARLGSSKEARGGNYK